MNATMLSSADERRLGDLGPKVKRGAGIIGLVGIGAAILIGLLMRDGFSTFLRAYLVAFLFILSICLGGLFFTMLQHITRAGWSVTVRRIAEGFASNLTWIWILFIPILIGTVWGDLHHHWTDPALLDPASPKYDEIIVAKSPYLNLGFWVIRAVIFFAVWAMLARFFVNNSIAQDHQGDPELTARMQWYAPIGILLYALTQTFAAFDWIMALEPHWFSTIFPVYFFAGSACGFFAVLAITSHLLQRSGRIRQEITIEHYQDLGKLLFAFGIVFWAYIAYSQYMLLWYANIAETTGWYIVRTTGPWAVIVVLLLVGHFIVPFLILMTKHTKRMPAFLAFMAVWMLVVHFFDLYWLARPEVPYELKAATNLDEFRATVTNEQLGVPGPAGILLDIVALVGMAGLLVAGTAHRLGQCSLIPEQDPRLDEAIAFENV